MASNGVRRTEASKGEGEHQFGSLPHLEYPLLTKSGHGQMIAIESSWTKRDSEHVSRRGEASWLGPTKPHLSEYGIVLRDASRFSLAASLVASCFDEYSLVTVSLNPLGSIRCTAQYSLSSCFARLIRITSNLGTSSLELLRALQAGAGRGYQHKFRDGYHKPVETDPSVARCKAI
ncbi:MAG: hypothetical protein V4527_04115 [Pseudomonadota bacterium]